MNCDCAYTFWELYYMYIQNETNGRLEHLFTIDRCMCGPYIDYLSATVRVPYLNDYSRDRNLRMKRC